jgi:excisionase family DNA binding protein
MTRQVAGPLRGVLVERVILSSPPDPFLSLKALADYSGLSVRTLRTYLHAAAGPLPCYRVGRKILVRRSEYDVWVTRYRQVGSPDLDRIAEAVRDLRLPRSLRHQDPRKS